MTASRSQLFHHFLKFRRQLAPLRTACRALAVLIVGQIRRCCGKFPFLDFPLNHPVYLFGIHRGLSLLGDIQPVQDFFAPFGNSL